MNRLNRLTLPLIFALVAAGMVVAVGEPVDDLSHADISVEMIADPISPVSVDLVEPELGREVELQRAEHAARVRWLITLPHARNVRRPI